MSDPGTERDDGSDEEMAEADTANGERPPDAGHDQPAEGGRAGT